MATPFGRDWPKWSVEEPMSLNRRHMGKAGWRFVRFTGRPSLYARAARRRKLRGLG